MSEAVILAAGIGSRLSSVHTGAPKCLVPVAGRAILDWQLQALVDVGVERVLIVTGYEAEQVRSHALGLDLPIDFSFIQNPDYARTNVLSSWLIGSSLLSTDHRYLHGDTVFELELLYRLVSVECPGVMLTVDRRQCGEEEMKVSVDENRVVTITKEMHPSAALGEFTGVLRASGRVTPILRELARELLTAPEGRRAFFEAALQLGIDRGSLRVDWLDVTGLRWREVDFPEDLEAADVMMSMEL